MKFMRRVLDFVLCRRCCRKQVEKDKEDGCAYGDTASYVQKAATNERDPGYSCEGVELENREIASNFMNGDNCPGLEMRKLDDFEYHNHSFRYSSSDSSMSGREEPRLNARTEVKSVASSDSEQSAELDKYFFREKRCMVSQSVPCLNERHDRDEYLTRCSSEHSMTPSIERIIDAWFRVWIREKHQDREKIAEDEGGMLGCHPRSSWPEVSAVNLDARMQLRHARSI